MLGNAMLVISGVTAYCFAFFAQGVGSGYHSGAILCSASNYALQSCQNQKLCILSPWHGRVGLPELNHVDNIWRGTLAYLLSCWY